MRDLFVKTTGRYLLHARLLWRSAPGLSLLTLLVTLGSGGAQTLAIVASGRLVGALPGAFHDGPGSAAASDAWFWLIWTAVGFVAGPVLLGVSDALARAVSARYLQTTFDMLLEVGTHPYGIAEFDDPKLAGRIDALNQAMRDWTFLGGIDSTWVVVQIRIGGIGGFIVTATWNWWAALIVLAGFVLMSKVVTAWINTFYDDLLDVTGTARRQATYVRKLLTAGETGKEIRLFGLAGWMIERFSRIWLDAMRLVWRNRDQSVRNVVAFLSISFVLEAGAFTLLARDAAAGAVGIGSVAMLVQSLYAIEGFGPIGDPQSELARNTAAAAELVAVRRGVGLPALPQREDRQPTEAPAPASAESRPDAASEIAERALSSDNVPRPATVEFTGVTFTYPSRTEPAFRDLTLHIPAGQSVAVVGVNGVGKSTLIKLLCGLYPTDSGTVRVDGRDPAADAGARARVAVIFQDFVRYHLSLRENVGFGAISHLDDAAALSSALTDAGGGRLLDRLPGGWDTTLSPEYADGTDLSGGQWQRVALARAFTAVRGGAGVLVLDEPTAALDVRAEAALFDRFLQVTHGLTTILVSHRLSSVRHAQRIVVLDTGADGRGAIVEDGSHEELLALGGHYAEMFTLQARRFTAAGAEVVG